MKSILVLIAAITFLASCSSSDRNYRLRVMKTQKVMIIQQDEIKGLKNGDTVQLDYSDVYNNWSIEVDDPYLSDTSYITMYKKDSTHNDFFLTNKKIAVIEDITK